ncbi:MAG: 30S ribosomal protein S8e [archaeon]
MVQWHMKSDRKVSGGRRRTHRRSTKKLAWRGGLFSETKLAEKQEVVSVKGRGNSMKNQLRNAVNANVLDPATKKTSVAKILTILENNANRQYARRNIITKGAVLEVELNGKKHAKVTSRPGQSGVINAVLIDSFEGKKTKAKKIRTEKHKKEPKQAFEKSLGKNSSASLNTKEEPSEKLEKKEHSKEEKKPDAKEKKESKKTESKE